MPSCQLYPEAPGWLNCLLRWRYGRSAPALTLGGVALTLKTSRQPMKCLLVTIYEVKVHELVTSDNSASHRTPVSASASRRRVGVLCTSVNECVTDMRDRCFGCTVARFLSRGLFEYHLKGNLKRLKKSECFFLAWFFVENLNIIIICSQSNTKWIKNKRKKQEYAAACRRPISLVDRAVTS